MPRVIDLTGQRFGRVKVVRLELIRRVAFWLCRCDCGKDRIIRGRDLRTGHTKSCGCLQKDNAGKSSITHGMRKTRFYRTFRGILARCNNPKEPGYRNYGARGIKCSWKSFEDFRDDMHESYLQHVKDFGERQTTIDRKNTDGHYCKENCQWSTYHEQNLNYRRNHLITFKSQTLTLFGWAEKLKLNYNTLSDRLRRGVSLERALTSKPFYNLK